MGKREELKQAVENVDSIYIDTCSLMVEKIEKFLEDLINIVNSQPKRPMINITQKVYDELTNILYNRVKYGNDTSQKAGKALKLIHFYETKGIFQRDGSAQDPFADANFTSLFAGMRIKKRILLISEDKKNIRAINTAFNSWEIQVAQRGYPITFFSVKVGMIKIKGNGFQGNAVGGNRLTQKPIGIAPKTTIIPEKEKEKKQMVKTTKKGVPNSSFTQSDGDRKLSVELRKNEGLLKKGIFKKKIINFVLDIQYVGDSDDKIKSLSAAFLKKDGTFLMKKPIIGTNEYSLEIDQIQYPNVQVTVEAEVKVMRKGLKPFKSTISKNF